jgi:putative DNA primase/helicase
MTEANIANSLLQFLSKLTRQVEIAVSNFVPWANEIKDELAQKNAKKNLMEKKAVCADDLKTDEPEKPRARQFKTDDTSYEKLGEILAWNPQGVLVFRDEMVTLLKDLEHQDRVSARGFFLTAWGGKNPYTFDRIIRGQTFIRAACVSMLGSTQPGRLAEFIRTSLSRSDDGMLQRFGLLVWPDAKTTWENIDERPDHRAKATAWATFQRRSWRTGVIQAT